MTSPSRPDDACPKLPPAACPAAPSEFSREARRQQWLLAALRGEALSAAESAWLGGSPARQRQGLQAYRANAAANAERALAAAYPTVQQLLGPQSFAALARAHWHRQPPECGDLGSWGAALPQAITEDDQLAGEPYLGDVARLDWALHQAERATDDEAPATGLALLAQAAQTAQAAQADPAALVLRLRAGHAVLVSAYPVYTLWQAHQHTAADRFKPVRRALAEQRAEAVRVRRQGWQAVAEPIDRGTADFEHGLLQDQTIATALAQAGPGFVFEPWFIATLRRSGLAAVLAAGGG